MEGRGDWWTYVGVGGEGRVMGTSLWTFSSVFHTLVSSTTGGEDGND